MTQRDEREKLAAVLSKIEFALRKDSLTAQERIADARTIVCAEISQLEYRTPAPADGDAHAEIQRLQDAKRRALALADERAKENVALREALNAIIDASQSFRNSMPKDWEGDPLQDAINAASALSNAAPASEGVRKTLDDISAKAAAEAICDYADNNLSMFEACSEENPVKARQLFETAKLLRDMFNGTFPKSNPVTQAERDILNAAIIPPAPEADAWDRKWSMDGGGK